MLAKRAVLAALGLGVASVLQGCVSGTYVNQRLEAGPLIDGENVWVVVNQSNNGLTVNRLSNSVSGQVTSEHVFLLRLTTKKGSDAVVLSRASHRSYGKAGKTTHSRARHFTVLAGNGNLLTDVEEGANKCSGFGKLDYMSSHGVVVACEYPDPSVWVFTRSMTTAQCHLNLKLEFEKLGIQWPQDRRTFADVQYGIKPFAGDERRTVVANAQADLYTFSSPWPETPWPGFKDSDVVRIKECGESVDKLHVTLQEGEHIVDIVDDGRVWAIVVRVGEMGPRLFRIVDIASGASETIDSIPGFRSGRFLPSKGLWFNTYLDSIKYQLVYEVFDYRRHIDKLYRFDISDIQSSDKEKIAYPETGL